MEIIKSLYSTPQGLAVLSAIIGATAALSAQIIAGFVNLARDLIMERVRANRRSKLAAALCASELENFRLHCGNLVRFWKMQVDPNDVMNAKHQIMAPNLSLPSHAELEFLDARTIVWLLHLKSQVSEIENAANPSGKEPSSYDNLSEYRREAYENLEKHVSKLLANLRRKYNLPSTHAQ